MSGDGSPWAPLGIEVLRDGDFSGDHLNRPGTYVVCFGAEWCPITRRFMPKFVAARPRLPGTLAVADITEMNSPLWDTFRIRITPSIVVFRDGKEHERVDGKRVLGITSGAMAQLERTLLPRE